MRMTSLVCAVIAASCVFAASCGSKRTTNDKQGPATATLAEDVPDGLDLRLSSGEAAVPTFDRARLAPATELAAPAVKALLARTKPLAADAADRQAFAFRPSSRPAPRTGQTIASTFPPPPSSLLPPTPADAGAALEVTRWSPEGEVPIAPALTVTFSQPMIAVTSQDEAARIQPVTLTPTPRGTWRWIGTRTIVFDPEVRFPQATTYRVEIPAGTKSARGASLAETKAFTFETPPPAIVSSWPPAGTPQQLDVPLFVQFDQDIDPRAVLAKLQVQANGKIQPVRLLEAAELEKLSDLRTRVAQAKASAQERRWIAFRSIAKLPADAAIEVRLAAGTPSAEGPNKTEQVQSFSFRTYPPLVVERAECGYGHECRPGMPLRFELNNPLDVEAFDAASVTIRPAIPDHDVRIQHDRLLVTGRTKPRTRYTVTLPGRLADTFGQTLGTSQTRTFDVGDAQPTFFGPSGLVVLDPAARKPTLDFFTTNHDALSVKLYKVTPADYEAYGAYVRRQWDRNDPPALPGTKVVDTVVKTGSARNALVESHIDLAPALGPRGLGHAIAIIEPSPWPHGSNPPRLVSWVQSTRLAVDAYVDAQHLIAFTTALDTGAPLSGVALELRPSGATATSDASGLATIGLDGEPQRTHYLVARKGDDVALIPEHEGYWSQSQWVRQEPTTRLDWYVTDDRKMYRPGEEVSIKGWLRGVDQGEGGDLRGLEAPASITYKVFDARRNELATGTITTGRLGGFDFQFTLPKTPNLGEAWIQLEARSGRLTGAHIHRLQVEEFRRPEFEVSAQPSQGPFLVGGGGDVTVSAKYFTGAPLPGADVNWYVTASQTRFTPPNRDTYVFGTWTPWWGDYDHGDYEHGVGRRPGRAPPAPSSWQLTGTTDGAGQHTLHLDFLSVKPTLPMSVRANASVSDVNRQTWSASSALLVHPSSLYVGLKTKKAFVEKGVPFELEVIGVDLDGKLAAGAKIDVTAVRLDWKLVKGAYAQTEVDPQACVVTIAADAGSCAFATREGGRYEVTATITDAHGRPNQSSLTFWVAGGDRPPAREVTQELVQLIPDKADYAPGTTAELLVQAPFYPAEGVVSWRRSGIVKTERITLDGPTKVITVPITDAMTPNLFVQVDLVGMAARTDDRGVPDPKQPQRPAYASGRIDLPVPPRHRTLSVTVTPAAAKVSPAAKTSLALEVRDAAGQPVADADVVVLVVDEAILSLTGHTFGNPIDAFYDRRDPGARDRYLREHVRLAQLPAVQTASSDPPPPMEAPGGGGTEGEGLAMMALEEGKMGNKDRAAAKPVARARAEAAAQPEATTTPIAMRTNFNPLAAWSPEVRTDAAGKATVEITMPDNLTRYRIVALAAAGTQQFGKGESAITARLPLMVRPSPPRFLNFGDTFQLPVVVQNQTDEPMTVELAVATTNVTLTDGAGRAVTVPANDRALVQFPAAAELAGTARFQIVGSAGSHSDAAELSIPVWTPATTEAFATYGVIDQGAIAQPVALPGQVVTQFGGLEITAASTNLQSLTDAMIYLVKYPYGCAEQRSSRILGIAALRDVLEAFQVEGLPSRAEMMASVGHDLEQLAQMQNTDGGFGFWDRGHGSNPYVSVHVANALARARAKDFAVPAEMIDRATRYLADIEGRIPADYPDDVRWTIAAYALYTRKQLGDIDLVKARDLVARVGIDKLSMEANGWLLGVFAGNPAATTERTAIVRHALNKVSETAGAANFTTGYTDGGHLILASDRRVDAIFLESLIQDQPALDLIPKLVTGLLAHRKAGRWLNTQENTFALLALDRYFQTYEKVTPSFVARVWLGSAYAGDLAFRGRSTTTFQVDIPMKDIATHDGQPLTIQKDGSGRLYYRIGMTYAPSSLKLDPADHGFVVERRYEAIDDPNDVTRDAAGVWHVKAGARVRVRLSMVTENRRYHVALVDPLPAGLEPLNPSLAVTGPVPPGTAAAGPTTSAGPPTRGRHPRWAYGPWYEHQNMRDERVEAFASLLREGVHHYEYVARATTPGTFVVPPPKAEEMYMPETFGRGASDRLIVE